MSHGKKIGKFKVSTVLAEYDLDVRLDLEGNLFVILVPNLPGGKIDPKLRTSDYESFSAPTLAEAKRAVLEHLNQRDTTDFVNVIEYDYRGLKTHSSWENTVSFIFRVARVSVAKGRNGRPKLEISVEVDEIGNVKITELDGKEMKPQAYNSYYECIMPYTVERWRQCCQIRDGIKRLDQLLFDLLGAGGEAAAAKLDAVGSVPMLAAAESKEKVCEVPREGCSDRQLR